MNYRLAFVFPYEGFENTLICITSFGPLTRFKPILNFPIFRKNGASLELLNIVFFEIVYQKGFFGKITEKKKRKEKKRNCRRILDIYWQRLLRTWLEGTYLA